MICRTNDRPCARLQGPPLSTTLSMGHPPSRNQLVNRMRKDEKSLRILRRYEKTFKSKDPVHRHGGQIQVSCETESNDPIDSLNKLFRCEAPKDKCSQRRVRGQSYWLGFLCKALSFSISSRFFPALSLIPQRQRDPRIG